MTIELETFYSGVLVVSGGIKPARRKMGEGCLLPFRI